MELKPSQPSFYGETIRSNRISGFGLVETLYPPDFRISRHSHERACFCFVLQGNFTEDYGKEIRSCEASTVIFRPPGEAHVNHFQKSGGRCFNIEINPRRTPLPGELLKIPYVSTDYRGGQLPSLAVRVYREFQRMDELSLLEIEGLTLMMLAEVSRAQARASRKRAPSWLEQARDLLHSNFAEALTLAKVAMAVGVHPVHLARTFREYHHSTVGEYIRKLRIEFACREILSSDLPLVQIALKAGFSHQSHFSTTFKRFTGTTPAEYRALGHLYVSRLVDI